MRLMCTIVVILILIGKVNEILEPRFGITKAFGCYNVDWKITVAQENNKTSVHNRYTALSKTRTIRYYSRDKPSRSMI